MGNSPLIFPVLGSILPPKYCLIMATQTHSPKPSIPRTVSAKEPDQCCNHLACTNWEVKLTKAVFQTPVEFHNSGKSMQYSAMNNTHNMIKAGTC